MKRLGGARSVCLDAYGTDPDMKKYDLETQRADKGAEPHRSRYCIGFCQKVWVYNVLKIPPYMDFLCGFPQNFIDFQSHIAYTIIQAGGLQCS